MPELQPIKFTEEQKRAFKAQHAPYASADQLDYFFLECERRALIPGKHVVFNLRRARDWNPVARCEVDALKVALITTLEAARVIADRYSDAHPDRAYLGHSPYLFYYTDGLGEVGPGQKIPQGRRPHAVSLELKRKDWTEPLFVVARFDAFAQKTSKGDLTKMWLDRGEEQLAKCAEVAGLRAIAPEDLGGLYLREEMESQLVEPEAAPESGQPAPVAIRTPEVNQAAAKEEPAIKPAPAEGPKPVTEAPKEVKQAPKAAKESATVPANNPTPTLFPAAPLAPVTGASVNTGGLDFSAPAATPAPAASVTAPLPDFFKPSAPEAAPIAPRAENPGPFEIGQPIDAVPEKSTSVPEKSTPPASASTASKLQRTAFMDRATRVIHNLAAKKVYTGDSTIMAKYLLKNTGKGNMMLLTPEEWEAKLKPLEAASLEEAAAMLKGAK